MTWGIVFIVIAVAMVVGPIMMFKPNSYTRRLEALRAEAASSGIKLRTVSYESRNQKQSVVVYNRLCETPFDAAILQRHDVAHDVHFYKQWDWQEQKVLGLSDTQQQWLKTFVEQLPATVVGVEFSPHSVGLWWQEKKLEQWGITDLKDALEHLHHFASPSGSAE